MSGRLVPYIPFSGSLVFEPEESGRTGPCLVHTGFTPAWFRRHMELDCGAAWHNDPERRRRTYVEMGRALNRVFPDLRLGGRPEEAVGTISQVNTCAFMAALFGHEIVYRADGWPDNRGAPLTDGQAERLRVPEFRSTAVFEGLVRQMDEIERRWGRIEGELNYQGVLNTAFRLRGQKVFEDMALAPARAHHLLDVVCDTMMQVIDAVHGRQEASGVAKGYFATANCVVNMISGAHYREFVLPRDRRLAAHFPRFGVHNCAWRVDPYVPGYAALGPIRYLDFGFDSDFALLKRTFPDAALAPMFSPVDLERRTPQQVRAQLERLRDQIGECRIILADIDAGTPDERVRGFLRLAAELWGVPAEELVPTVRNF